MSVEVRTVRSEIRGVAERWRHQYFHGGEWSKTFHGSTQRIYDGLKALDVESATPEDVAAIIGNGSWVSLTCDNCKREQAAVIDVPTSDDFYGPASVCLDCIKPAVKELSGSRG
jgi:hypothetical protein